MLAISVAKRSGASKYIAKRCMSTVVDDEVRKFNEASSDWWTPGARTGFGPLHDINPVRVKYIREHVIKHFKGSMNDPEPLTGFHVADVGCGGGLLSESLCRLGGSMVSVDPGESNIAMAKKHAMIHPRTRDIEYRCATSHDLVNESAQFDVVCSLEVVEHVSDVTEYLHSLTALVKPGGLLFMSTINRTPLAAALAVGAAEYVLGVVPPGTHDWRKFVQPEEITSVLQEDGLAVRDISGIVGNPICNDWKIDPDMTAINYILCASKPL